LLKRLVLLVGLLLLMTAANVRAAEKVPITVWFYTGSSAVSQWAEGFEKAFNEANPDIELKFDMVDWNTVRQTVLIASASGTGPDISYLSGNLIPDWINKGMTLPLNRYIEASPDKDDFISDLFLSVSDAKGQIHAMPFAMWGVFDLYNMDVLNAGGVDLPNSWDELIAAARKMTVYNADRTVARYGYAAPQHASEAIYTLHMNMEQLGKGLLYYGDTRADLYNDRGRRAANYIRDLWAAGNPDYQSVSNMTNSVSGKLAINGYATYNLIEINPEDSASLLPRRVVGPEPGQDIVRYNCGVLYILSTSKNPDKAWRVLEAFLSPQNSEGYIRAQVSYLPVRKSVLRKMNTLIEHPLAAKMAGIMYSPMTTYGAVHELWTTLWPAGGNILLGALQGKTGIEGALQEAERAMNTIIAEELSRN